MTQGNLKNIVVAGAAAADGEGSTIGWSGRGAGSCTREEITDSLKNAGMPVEWAPNVKSAVAYAGQAVSPLNARGFVARRTKAAEWTGQGSNKSREYRARWTVHPAANNATDLGDAPPPVVLVVELHDGSDDLVCRGDQVLAAEVVNRYEATRNAEEYKAGDVTAWLQSTLKKHFGAATFRNDLFVPRNHVEGAAKLCHAVARVWHAKDLDLPPLPVASSEALQAGIARGFYDEIRKVTEKLDKARADAREKGKGEISPRAASGMLKELAEIDSRADGYKILCGADALQDAIAELRKLSEDLGNITQGSAARFAMLELDRPKAQWAEAPAPAIKAAEKALEEHRAKQSNIGRVETITQVTPAEAKPEPHAMDRDAAVAIYRAERQKSGMAPAEFKRACNARMGNPDKATPAQWADAAKAVNAALAKHVRPDPEQSPVNDSIAARGALLELD